MSSFHDTAHNPPPPSPMTVQARHGTKFKVWVFGRLRIMDQAAILKMAAERREAGAIVQLNGFIRE